MVGNLRHSGNGQSDLLIGCVTLPLGFSIDSPLGDLGQQPTSMESPLYAHSRAVPSPLFACKIMEETLGRIADFGAGAFCRRLWALIRRWQQSWTKATRDPVPANPRAYLEPVMQPLPAASDLRISDHPACLETARRGLAPRRCRHKHSSSPPVPWPETA